MQVAFGKLIVPILAGLALSACQASRMSAVPAGGAAYAIVPPAAPQAPGAAYIIVPEDTLDVQVFLEPELSNDSLRVDQTGDIQLPLIGTVVAAGRSPQELADVIEARLAENYLVDPQVVVSVKEAAARFVAVEGEVRKPGVYEIGQQDTLLSAIARAESPTDVARLDEVVVFRVIDGERRAARFDLRDVRAGLAPDPQIVGGDVVVVGFSSVRGAWQDFLKAAPIFNAFIYTVDRR